MTNHQKCFACVDCKKTFVYWQSMINHRNIKHNYTSDQRIITKCERHGFLEPCPMCENQT